MWDQIYNRKISVVWHDKKCANLSPTSSRQRGLTNSGKWRRCECVQYENKHLERIKHKLLWEQKSDKRRVRFYRNSSDGQWHYYRPVWISKLNHKQAKIGDSHEFSDQRRVKDSRRSGRNYWRRTNKISSRYDIKCSKSELND